jgi:hypothetical protein
LFINLKSYEIAAGTIEIEGIQFKISKAEGLENGFVRMALLEHSTSHPYTGKTIKSDNSHSLKIDVNKSVKAFAFLYVSECQSRQTGVDVGEINLNYESGDADKIALNVGKNFDSLFSHFAKDAFPIAIHTPMQYYSGHPGTDYINLLVISCDFTRSLNSIEFIINLPDVEMGLIGISFI